MKPKEVKPETMASLAKKLPVPKGATLISETKDEEDYVLNYSYTGDMKKAIAWVKDALKKQGWKVDEATGETAYAIGSTVEAEMDKYELDVSFSQATGSGTITYTLSE